MKKIHLPISKNYVSHWGFWEGAREILQNAIDTDDYRVEKSFTKGQLSVISNGGFLDISTLMLGESSKRDDNSSIGKYGEGYKLAMMVLCRGGNSVTVFNGAEIWEVSIEQNPQLECEGLCITIKENCTNYQESLKFVVSGLSEENFNELDRKFICMESTPATAEYDGSYCFESDVKSVYVGGLFVCDLPEDDNYWFSYNFAPNVLELDRDRSAVHDFYLQLRATEIIANSGNLDLLSEMAMKKAKDISDYYTPRATSYGGSSSSSSDQLKEISLRAFIKEHGENAYPINEDDTAKIAALTKKAIALGMIPVMVKKSFYKMLPSSIKDKIKAEPISGLVSDLLEKFLKDNKSRMQPLARKNFVSLIEKIQLNGK